mmetsp:Transcript_45510/g.51018  ORF Transcript_45510/g.51018 Transcript_45510/m.51018 type:complete len:147 (+) Transcript_45510:119-559(+)|eukprot:CAMPEP_0170854204 /NCGR_PEP_ID=MMETSP0734-20130129/13043_1 /TAXON_ID=186038 /ORGANISM="Fragilariopsis kerguelensis, Strain L26-C5" /LENGTH=146 /DNA_ID=CAMNT_0011225177 /DNA_START=114 /DNA_END=554 /DNA_ORIENTATION=+
MMDQQDQQPDTAIQTATSIQTSLDDILVLLQSRLVFEHQDGEENPTRRIRITPISHLVNNRRPNWKKTTGLCKNNIADEKKQEEMTSWLPNASTAAVVIPVAFPIQSRHDHVVLTEMIVKQRKTKQNKERRARRRLQQRGRSDPVE